MINRELFFQGIKKLFPSGFNQLQVDGINVILDYWEANGLYEGRHLAYMLATTYHETGRTMQPIEEYGKGKGRKYGMQFKHSGVPYSIPDKLYYGRGFVQLTWFENYELMGRLLGVDLINQPELALLPEIAVQIMFEGMLRGSSSFGDFTGKCLEMYFNDDVSDPVNARRIINGTDKAELIAGYYSIFLNAIIN